MLVGVGIAVFVGLGVGMGVEVVVGISVGVESCEGCVGAAQDVIIKIIEMRKPVCLELK